MSDKYRYQIRRRKLLKTFLAGTIVTSNFSDFAISGVNKKEVIEKMNINVIISFEVKDDKVADFRNILNSVKNDLPKIEGCIDVEIFKSTSAENKFTLVETWETEDIHKNYISNISKDGTWDMIASHLSKDPRSGYFVKI